MAVVRRLAEELRRLGRILLHAAAVEIELAERVERLRIAALAGEAEPVGGGGDILLHAEPARKQHAEQRLRHGVARSGALQRQREGGEEPAALKGAEGVVGRKGRLLAGRRQPLVDALLDPHRIERRAQTRVAGAGRKRDVRIVQPGLGSARDAR